MASNPALTTAAVIAVAIALGSCGGSSDQANTATQSERDQRLPLEAEEKRLEERRLVSGADVVKSRPGSIQRAFYDYWSSLENEEWTIALAYYSPEIQRRLKPATLVAALRLEAQNLPVKPLIRAVRSARANQTSVRYYLRRSDGKLRPTSMIWRSRGGRWYVVYSSTLDESYGSAVQQSVQTRLDPSGKSDTRQALAAGVQASRAQAATLGP